MNSLRISTLVAALVACATVGCATVVSAAPLYHLTNLGNFGGGSSHGYGVNLSGQIAGNSTVVAGPDDHAFLYTGGTKINLGLLSGGSESFGNGINDSGVLVGYGYTSGFSTPNAFYYDGTVHNIGTLGVATSIANAINNAGLIVGSSSNGSEVHAFSYNGSFTDLQTLGGTLSSANAVNASGKIVGYSFTSGNATTHAFLYNGSMTDIGTLGGATSSANGINAAGLIVGQSLDAGGNDLGFISNNGAPMTPLGALGGNISSGLGINSSGQIVGYAFTSGNNSQEAALFIGSTAFDLNSLLDASGTGWQLSTATAINDKGWIVAYGQDPNDGVNAVLLTPVPEPSSIALLALGGLALGGMTMRRLKK